VTTKGSTACAFVFVLVLSHALCAQGVGTWGSVVGKVTDSTGAVIPNVAVVATDTGKSISRSATTDTVFFVRCGSRILRGGGCRFWLGDAGKSILSGSGAVEQGADKAKPPVRGGFTWFHVRTRGPYQLHLYGDRFRECETKD
jgi:predicted molibdopterin-dependent oxidoreductase YjgC